MGTGFTQFDCHNAKTLSCNTSIIDNNGTGCNNIVTGGYCGTNYNLYTAPEKVYKFTVTENTPLEEDVALDPELLGRVFENLLASYNPETKATARKQTGSFYTPREIVNYMVDESLIAHFKTKLLEKAVGANVFGTKENVMFPEAASKKAQLSLTVPIESAPSKKTEEDIENKLRELVSYSEAQPFEKKETLILIDAINSMKILDPACGSGAFPMGILHKLVHVLQKLDPKNDEWKRIQIEHAKRTPDSTLRNHLIKEIESAFNEDKNRRDYGRKLYILKNCIYGVDIQPIAIEISKLRFFISLIVDQKANNARKDNFGIIPLPNLENNFVAANTLIALDKPKEATFGDHLLKEKEKELKDIRQQHFDARTYKDKQALRKKDKAKREEIAALLKQFGFPAKTASLVAAWNPYDRLKSSEWFDPEYMFEIHTGFDVVIGNPPYVQLQNIKIEPEIVGYYKSKYKSAKYKIDLYHLFIELGINLLTIKGIISYIVPNTFTKNKFADNLRSFIVNNTNIVSVVNFYIKVFEDPSVDNLVFVSQKGKNANNTIRIFDIKNSLEEDLKKFRFFPQMEINKNDYVFEFNISDNKIIKTIDEHSVIFKSIGGTYFGIQTFDRSSYVKKVKVNKHYLPVIDGGNVHRFFYDPPVEYVDFRKESIKSGGKIEIYKLPRILVRQIGKYPEGTLSQDNILTLNTIYNLFITNSNVNIRYCLGILNSKMVSYYWLSRFFDDKESFPKIKKDFLEQLPIPRSPIDNPKLQQPLITLVDKILAAKGKDPLADTSKWEAEIDARVFHLYGLTEEEMLTVLNSFPKMSIVEKTQIQNFYRDLERGNFK